MQVIVSVADFEISDYRELKLNSQEISVMVEFFSGMHEIVLTTIKKIISQQPSLEKKKEKLDHFRPLINMVFKIRGTDGAGVFCAGIRSEFMRIP